MPPRAFKPSVTVAAVIERDGFFLMVEERTDDGVRLNQPAGHLEAGETLPAACAREVLEETAHRFSPQALLGAYLARFVSPASGEEITYLRFAFTGALGAQQVGRALDDGILRTLWLTADEVRAQSARHRSPLVQRCIDDYLAGRRWPLQLLHADPSALGALGALGAFSALSAAATPPPAAS
jgi:8-oxo-dGTP pyrophosphatase MutT (NUDIX family)